MRKIIYDVSEIEYFCIRILPELNDNEVYFASLSARNKYLNDDERDRFGLGRTEMFARSIIRNNDLDRFIRVIRRFETPNMAYTTKNGLPIPDRCLVCYININPTDAVEATLAFVGDVLDEVTRSMNSNDDSGFFSRADLKLMKRMQNTRTSKRWIDIDFDVPHENEELVYYFYEACVRNNIECYVIKTKGGFHAMIRRSDLREQKWNYTEALSICNDMARNKIPSEIKWEIVNNRNEMVPLPGTLQAGFKVCTWNHYIPTRTAIIPYKGTK